MNATGARQRGFSLIEMCVALLILLVVITGLMPAVALATRYTENNGNLSARATEYATDKMEQLLALAWNDELSDTTVFPTRSSGGTGLKPGGTTNTATPVAGYVDWLDINGNLLPSSGTTPPAQWFHQRVWRIVLVSAHLKRIAVVTTVRSAVGSARVPRSAIVTVKTDPF